MGLKTRLNLAWKAFRQQLPAGTVAQILPNTRTPPRFGTQDLLRAYTEMPWLRAAVDRIAIALASTRWMVFAVRHNGKFVRNRALQYGNYYERRKKFFHLGDTELIEIEDHPIIGLLNGGANTWFTGFEIRKLTSVYMDTVGEAWWLKERNAAGAPVSVWPVPPTWVHELPVPGRPVVVLQLGGETVEIPLTELVWFRHLDPANPFGRGSGYGQALGDELATDEYIARHIKQWFFNSARPELLITVPGASEAELRHAEARWTSRLQGFWRAWKPYFVNQNVDVKEIGQSFREMQLTDLRKFERDLIIQVFGVPPELLGIIESSNRATIEAADHIMARYVLQPRLEFMRLVLQERLVPEYDDRLIIDYESPVQADRQYLLDAARAQPASLTVDEWRELQGLAPLPDGRGAVFLTPLSVVSTEEPGGGSPPEMPPPDQGDHAPRYRSVDGLIGVRQNPQDPEDYYATVHRIADRLAPRFRRAWLRAVQRTQGMIDLDALEAALRSGSPTAVARLVPELEPLLRETGFLALLRAAISEAGKEAARELSEALGVSISFSELNPHSVEFIQRWTGELITAITEQQREAVREIIERSFKEAIPPREAAKLIRGVLGLHSRQVQAVANFRARLIEQGVDLMSVERRTLAYANAQLRKRALTIARTETLRAANAGQQLLWKQAAQQGVLRPGKTRRVWIVTPDDRLDQTVCEPIPHMEENQDVGLDEPFTTGTGERVMNPPAHPNCRCAVALKLER
ncbi:MAG: hypothetical protein KatS3mg109_0422 [Pirellulaceae bacterium]|nr:MAG: hypothetical protein KatS3mg109_0422 [Pirellulaceae bacterium]